MRHSSDQCLPNAHHRLGYWSYHIFLLNEDHIAGRVNDSSRSVRLGGPKGQMESEIRAVPSITGSGSSQWNAIAEWQYFPSRACIWLDDRSRAPSTLNVLETPR